MIGGACRGVWARRQKHRLAASFELGNNKKKLGLGSYVWLLYVLCGHGVGGAPLLPWRVQTLRIQNRYTRVYTNTSAQCTRQRLRWRRWVRASCTASCASSLVFLPEIITKSRRGRPPPRIVSPKRSNPASLISLSHSPRYHSLWRYRAGDGVVQGVGTGAGRCGAGRDTPPAERPAGGDFCECRDPSVVDRVELQPQVT